MTLGALSLGNLGLSSEDPCYDPNGHPWYDWGLESIWNTPYECQCMIDNNYPIGQQCATPSGVVAVTAGAVGGAANVVGEGLGTGIATGVGSFAQNINFSGIALLAVAGFVAYALLSKR